MRDRRCWLSFGQKANFACFVELLVVAAKTGRIEPPSSSPRIAKYCLRVWSEELAFPKKNNKHSPNKSHTYLTATIPTPSCLDTFRLITIATITKLLQPSSPLLHPSPCHQSAQHETASRHQMASTTSKTHSSSLAIRWKMQKMLRTRVKRGMKCSGRYFRSVINVSLSVPFLFFSIEAEGFFSKMLTENFQGSRYIYDLYYEKEAISKQLYEWLLKNNYAEANLIAKWKKQGYEKVCSIYTWRVAFCSCVVHAAWRWTSADSFRLLVMLPSVHSNQRDKFQLDVYMPCSQSSAERGSKYSVRELRVSRVCE